jgi:hypothetical protein
MEGRKEEVRLESDFREGRRKRREGRGRITEERGRRIITTEAWV